MRVQVRFRVNQKTGEVEEFIIEDISTSAEADHEAVHDRIAYEVGKVVERRPAPEQVIGGGAADAPPLLHTPQDELPQLSDRETETE